jgi:hypothetical protein
MRPLLERSPQAVSPAPVKDKSKLRYNWWRAYEDIARHPKWRRVSIKSGVELPRVVSIVLDLLCTASKARQARGSISNFDFEDCAAALNIPPDDVAAVMKCLYDIGWLDQEWIVDWMDRNPDKEDPSAADRQRNKRRKDRAQRAVAMGIATPAQKELVSRVTAGEPMLPPGQEERVFDLVLVRPDSGKPEDVEAARETNEQMARLWLLGDGSTHVYGSASKMVADYLSVKRLSADLMIRGWLEELGDDVVALAEIIAETDRQALNARAFDNMVRQRVEALVKLKANKDQRELQLGGRLVKR